MDYLKGIYVVDNNEYHAWGVFFTRQLAQRFIDYDKYLQENATIVDAECDDTSRLVQCEIHSPMVYWGDNRWCTDTV